MAPGATIVGSIFLLTGAGLLALLREPLRQPGKPGSRWFALTVVGIALWPLSLGVSYFLADRGLSILAWNGRAIAATVISVGWFLLAVEYTTRERPPRLLLAALGAFLLVDVVVTATNPLHHLFLTNATGQVGTVLVPDYTMWFWAHTIVDYGLILLATALLVFEWAGSSTLQRRQAGILAVAVVPPAIANLLTLLPAMPSLYDLTPFGLVGSGILLTWALYRVEFLDVVPVAREAVMEEMRDAVVTLDGERRVVDCNGAARDLFDLGGDYVGRSAEELFDVLPADVLDRFEAKADTETQVSVETPDGTRHFSVSISPVAVGSDVAGRVVVLRDVTPLVARERALEERQGELDLLRQVLTRVLRHNLRNALTTIHGNAETLVDELEGEHATRARRILDASDGLVRISDKAGHVERIAADDEPVTHDLSAVVGDVVADCRPRFPAVRFETDVPGRIEVEAGRGLQVAVEALVENAAEYGDAADPRVTVRIEHEGPRLHVTDNGSGIPESEVDVLEAHEETPLEHGSGIGLWLAKWVADHSGATLRFDSGRDGTTVTMDFGRERGAVAHPPEGGPFDDAP